MNSTCVILHEPNQKSCFSGQTFKASCNQKKWKYSSHLLKNFIGEINVDLCKHVLKKNKQKNGILVKENLEFA